MSTATTTELDELRERVLAGDDNVTVAQLAKARDSAQHAELLAEAARLQAERAAAAQLEADRGAFRADTLVGLSHQLETLQGSYDELVAALARFTAGVDAFEVDRKAAHRPARRLGLEDEWEDVPRLDRPTLYARAIDEGAGRYRWTNRQGRRVLMAHPLHSATTTAAINARFDEEDGPRHEQRRARAAELAEAAEARRAASKIDPGSDELLASIGSASAD